MKSTELQQQINNLDHLIDNGILEDGSRASDAQLNLMEMTRTEKRKELDTTLAEETSQQERVQAQAEKVDSITLAYDYNEILGNPLANETIIENVKQFLILSDEEHNAEVARINAKHIIALDSFSQKLTDYVKAHSEEKEQLQQRLNAETEQAQLDAVEILELSQQVAQLGLEKKDADSKRDAALFELSEALATIESQKQAAIENVELKAQVEALQQELTAKKALTVNGSDKLAELANKAKESTIAKANRGLERWNEQYGLDIPVLAIPELEPVTEVVEPVTEIPFQTETEVHSAESGLVDQSQSVPGEGLEEKSEVITLESLKAEVDAIKSHLGLVA